MADIDRTIRRIRTSIFELRGPLDGTAGLANLRTRAERHGGSFEVFAGDTIGTTVIWKAPLL